MPLPIWQNDGNLGNVMVVGGGSGVVGIDQQVNLIVQGPAREKYLAKVEKLTLSVLPGGDARGVVENLEQALAVNCGVAPLPAEHAELVLRGLRDGLRGIAEASQSGALAACLETAKQACYDRLHYDHARKWAKMLLRNEELLDMIAFVTAVGETVAATVAAAAAAEAPGADASDAA